MPSRSLLIALVLGAVLSLSAAPAVVYEAGEPGLEPPRLLEDSRVQPVVPEEALQDGVQGTVLLRVVVTAEGRVSHQEIFRSPYRGESLAQAAVDAVRQWRYQPARLQGRNVACRIMQAVAFYPPSKEPSKQPRRRPRHKKARRAPESVEAKQSTPMVGEAAAPATPSKEKDTPVQVNPAAAGDTANSAVHAEVADTPAASIPRPEAQPRVPAVMEIDIRSGGPRSLLLGQPATRAGEFLGGAEKREGGKLQRLPEHGMEVTLASSPEGEQVVAIRYVFTDGGGFAASALRTRKGLGRGSFCLGIIPAYGRPDERRESTDGNGEVVLILEYRREGTRAVFVCRDGRLTELTLAREPE